jgi:Flp pilus assembly protein TadB
MEYVLAFIAGLSFLLIWAGLTRPAPVARPQAEKSEQYRIRALRGGLGFLAAAVEDLASWFQGRGTEDVSWRGGLNARYLRQLKQADWYWAPKLFHALLFAAGGLVLAGVPTLLYSWHPTIPLVAAIAAGVAGFFDPDSELAGAAEKRRRQIILEMGYKVAELRAYIQSGRTFAAAMRYLTQRPGGPFVKELFRVLQIYDITADLDRGLRVVLERNAMCQPLISLIGDLLAMTGQGGEVGPVLEAHSDTAQHEQARLLRQQGEDNSQQMSYVVAGTTLVVIFLLIGMPALWTVMTTL